MSRMKLWIYALIGAFVLWGCSRCGVSSNSRTIVSATNTVPSLSTITSVPRITPTATSTMLTPMPSPSAINEPEIEPLDIQRTFTYAAFQTSQFSNSLESYVYILTASDTMLDVKSGTRTIWRFGLRDNRYDRIAFWSLADAPDLNAGLPEDHKVGFCERYQIDPQTLSEHKAWFDPIDIQLSPDGQHLAIGAQTWASGLDLALIKSSAILLDIDTGEKRDIQSRFTETQNESWCNFLWAPDGSKVALTWCTKYDNDLLFVYELASSLLTHVGESFRGVWTADSQHLVLQDMASEANDNLLVFDVTNQLTHTLNLPFTGKVIGSQTGNVWIAYSDAQQNLHLAKLNNDLEGFEVVAHVNKLHMATPQGNADGNFLVWERHPVNEPEFLQTINIESQETYPIFDIPFHAWEWSGSSNALLVSYLDEHQTTQVAIIKGDEASIVTLPSPPDSNWIVDTTW